MKTEILMPNNRHFAAARTAERRHRGAAVPAAASSPPNNGGLKMSAEQRWRKYMTLSPKVGSSVLAGALTNIIVAECTRRGVTIAGDEGTAITTVLMFLAGYFTPH